MQNLVCLLFYVSLSWDNLSFLLRGRKTISVEHRGCTVGSVKDAKLFHRKKTVSGTSIKMTCTVTMGPFSCEDEENLAREQCRHQGHKLCFSLPGKAKYIFIFLPSVFAFSFSKIWVKHCLVKKEESLPVVKLPFHPWQLGSHKLKQIFFFLSGDCFWSEHRVWL